jgi:hypothetical protein
MGKQACEVGGKRESSIVNRKIIHHGPLTIHQYKCSDSYRETQPAMAYKCAPMQHKSLNPGSATTQRKYQNYSSALVQKNPYINNR